MTRDGSEVARAAWGAAMPVDGGSHEIVATAPGRAPWKTTVQIPAENDKQTVVVPLLEPAPAPPPAPTQPTRPSLVVAPRQARPAGPSSWARQRTLGFIVGGVGVLGVGAGTYFGLQALSKKDESAALCTRSCTVRGSELSKEATKNADWSTASFAFGIAALGLGTYLVLSTDEGSGARVGLVLAPGAGAVRGAF